MDQFDSKTVDTAYKEAKKMKNSLHPLTAILLLADYSQPELEDAIGKLHAIDFSSYRINLRFNIVFQLLENQKNKIYRQKDNKYGALENSYDDIYCDFKEVMKILGRSKNTTESFINKNKIRVLSKPGEKRRFLRKEIMEKFLGTK
jgi:hypothetical protein